MSSKESSNCPPKSSHHYIPQIYHLLHELATYPREMRIEEGNDLELVAVVVVDRWATRCQLRILVIYLFGMERSRLF